MAVFSAGAATKARGFLRSALIGTDNLLAREMLRRHIAKLDELLAKARRPCRSRSGRGSACLGGQTPSIPTVLRVRVEHQASGVVGH